MDIKKEPKSHGGKRPGAGRKFGSKTAKTMAIATAAAQSGLTPLEYMLDVLRNPKAELARRDEMARAAAPYIHPRLQQVEQKIEGTITQRVISAESISADEWERRYNGAIESSDYLGASTRSPEGLN